MSEYKRFTKGSELETAELFSTSLRVTYSGSNLD